MNTGNVKNVRESAKGSKEKQHKNYTASTYDNKQLSYDSWVRRKFLIMFVKLLV